MLGERGYKMGFGFLPLQSDRMVWELWTQTIVVIGFQIYLRIAPDDDTRFLPCCFLVTMINSLSASFTDIVFLVTWFITMLTEKVTVLLADAMFCSELFHHHGWCGFSAFDVVHRAGWLLVVMSLYVITMILEVNDPTAESICVAWAGSPGGLARSCFKSLISTFRALICWAILLV